MKSAEQKLVDRVKKTLKRDPARASRLRVEWDKAMSVLADYLEHKRPKLMVWEAHHFIERARAGMLTAIEAGVADNTVWIYALHGAGFPAAPHRERKVNNVRPEQ